MARKINRTARKDELMVKARLVAQSGVWMGWRDVVGKFAGDEQATLRIWLTVLDKDELDRLCDLVRLEMKRRAK